MTNVMGHVSNPRRKRISFKIIVSCGFTLEGNDGGLITTALILVFGWRSVLIVDGIILLLLSILMLPRLPESIHFLSFKKED